MRRYDLQVHTNVSPCSRAKPADVVSAAIDRDLDGIAITNHDTLEGCEEVQNLAPNGLRVIFGVEVTTTQGHLLALDIETVPPKDTPLNVIADVKKQGGLAVLSHPFDRLRERYNDNLSKIAARVDAVETINSRCLLSRYNRRAREFAHNHDLAVTGGSDAHFPMEIGRAVTVCEGPVLEAIQTKQTKASGRGGYMSGHVTTKVNDLLNRVWR